MQPKLSGTQETIGYCHWLMMRGQHAGNLCFDGHTATDEKRDITRSMQELSDLIKKRLATCKPEDAGDLLDCYEMTHRIGFKEEPAHEFINSQRKRVLKAWMDGERNIEEKAVFTVCSLR